MLTSAVGTWRFWKKTSRTLVSQKPSLEQYELHLGLFTISGKWRTSCKSQKSQLSMF